MHRLIKEQNQGPKIVPSCRKNNFAILTRISVDALKCKRKSYG